ncbi:hypothetical protein ACVWZK_004145 [Bradyrhizobium sp. GM0.4]
MAASDYVPIFFKNRLHLAGRPRVQDLALLWQIVDFAAIYRIPESIVQ